MKAVFPIGVFVSFCLLSPCARGATLERVISEGPPRIHTTSETVEFSSVEKVESLDPRGYEFTRFLVNRLRINKRGVAELFYAKEDIMPPCMFVHTPGYPKPKRICQARSMDSLRAILGREHEKDDVFSRWSFFAIVGEQIRIIHISVTRENGEKVGGIVTFEATTEVAKFKFK